MVDDTIHGKNKKQRIQNNIPNNGDVEAQEEEDRLSSLPDSILIDILSLLPINSAAITTVLSHRWLGLWTQVTAVRINRDYFSIAKTLRIPNPDDILGKLTSPVIDVFEMYAPFPGEDCAENDEDDLAQIRRLHGRYICSWILQICSRFVKKFKFWLQEKYEDQYFHEWCVSSLPDCVFQTQSLVKLSLNPWCSDYFYSKGVICLPNLKKLRIFFDCEEKSLSRLIKSCPLLEHLILEGRPFDYIETIEISAQNLKLLKINMGDFDPTELRELRDVVIDAPKLEHLHLENVNYSSFRVCSSLTKVMKINFGMKMGIRELELISDLLKVAIVLKTLDIRVIHAQYGMGTQEVLWKELEFCQALYSFPRSSSSVEVTFSGKYLSVSSKGMKIGALDSRVLCCTRD